MSVQAALNCASVIVNEGSVLCGNLLVSMSYLFNDPKIAMCPKEGTLRIFTVLSEPTDHHMLSVE